MSIDIDKEVVALQRMTVGQLHERYAEIFGGETARSRHKQYLIRRIAWRIQANAEGGLSERALRRAEELANIADVRVTPPKMAKAAAPVATGQTMRARVIADSRLPSPGTAITRRYKGRILTVNVRTDGFEYDGERFRSLSAVAKKITGSHMNGYRFFGLEGDQ